MRKISTLLLILVLVTGFIPAVSATASLSVGSVSYDTTVVKDESITVSSSVTASSVSGTLTVDVTLTDNSGLFTIPTATQQLQFTTDSTKSVSWTITATSSGNYSTPFTISASGDDSSSASKTSSTVVTVQDRPVLTVSTSTSASSVVASDSVTVNYTVSNSASAGAADATNVQISLSLPGGWSLSSGSSPYSLGTMSPQASTSGSWVVSADSPSSSNTLTLSVTSTIPGGTVSTTASITGPDSTDQTSNSGGGGGGGGGGSASSENINNIEVKEKYELHIYKDKTTSYSFTNDSNPVMFVNITGNNNAGPINTAVEVLRTNSSLVERQAPGNVYKNINIWVGSSGFAVPRNIKEAIIDFRVENEWIKNKDLTSNDIKLVKWDGNNWIQLETEVRSEESEYTYFNGKTDSFSSFAITALNDEVVPAAVPATEVTEKPVKTEKTATPKTQKKGLPGFEVISAITCFSAIYLFRRNKK